MSGPFFPHQKQGMVLLYQRNSLFLIGTRRPQCRLINDRHSMQISAIIPAAGLGKRFGAKKQFLEIAGKPVLIHTLQAFETAPSVTHVVVVVPQEEKQAVHEMLARYPLKKISAIVPGGAERQDSVRLGLEAVPPCELVIVHDGVRPLVTPELIERILEVATRYGAAVAGLPTKETLKRVNSSGIVEETVDRSAVWNIQTPQAFRYELFRRAVRKSVVDRFLGTDESMLVERLGEKVKVVPGSLNNIKITTPEDFKIAEMILREGLQ